MKSLRWVGVAFLAFGLVFLAVALAFAWSSSATVANGVTAEGTVVDLERRYSSDNGTTYRPVVQFVDRSGTAHRFVGSVGSSPAAYSRGESVAVIYDPDSPEDALLDSFTERHLFPLAFGGFGTVFAGLGAGFLIWIARRRRTIARLRQSGMRIDAQVLSCGRDRSIKVNGRSPFRVHAQAVHPATGKLASYRSEAIWVDLSDMLSGKSVPVLLDPNAPKAHYIDLSEWIGESEYA